jgi:hypothetical protein
VFHNHSHAPLEPIVHVVGLDPRVLT